MPTDCAFAPEKGLEKTMMADADPVRLPASMQALEPARARLCLAVARFIKRDLELDLRGSSLLIGFSGGADSMALLLILHYLSPSLHLGLTAAHLDHGLRPSSALEADFCRAFCRRLGIACLSERCDIAGQRRLNRTGLEEEGRTARYAFFARMAESTRSDWIVTGHQNNDLAEDLLMRLLRGAGWPALGGMPAVDKKRGLLRPLLLTPKKDLECFLASLGLDWLRDESNEDRSCLRNRVRQDLLPPLMRENPSFLDAIAGLWRLGRLDGEYFDTHLPEPVSDPGASSGRTLFTPREQLAALPKALRLRFYKKILARLGSGQALLSSLLSLDRAWQEGGGRTVHCFPGGKSAIVDKTGIAWVFPPGAGPKRPWPTPVHAASSG